MKNIRVYYIMYLQNILYNQIEDITDIGILTQEEFEKKYYQKGEAKENEKK